MPIGYRLCRYASFSGEVQGQLTARSNEFGHATVFGTLQALRRFAACHLLCGCQRNRTVADLEAKLYSRARCDLCEGRQGRRMVTAFQASDDRLLHAH